MVSGSVSGSVSGESGSESGTQWGCESGILSGCELVLSGCELETQWGCELAALWVWPSEGRSAFLWVCVLARMMVRLWWVVGWLGPLSALLSVWKSALQSVAGLGCG